MRPRGRSVPREVTECPSPALPSMSHSHLHRLGHGCHSEGAAATPCGQGVRSTSVPQASLVLGFLCCFSSPLCGGLEFVILSQMLPLEGEMVYKAPGGLETHRSP